MRGVLHAEVFGFNFSADINPYQRSDDCVIAAGQITERPRRLSKTSADAPETERGTQVGGTHEHTSMCLSSSEMWLMRSIARNHVQSPVFFLKGVYEGRSLYMLWKLVPVNMNKQSRDTSLVLSEWHDRGERRPISSGATQRPTNMCYEDALNLF